MISIQTLGDPGKCAIVCIHGFMGQSEDWQSVMNGLPRHLFYVLVDLPGHGRVDIAESTTVEGVLADLYNRLIALGVQEVVLLGYSMGGRIALQFLKTYPNFVCGIGLLSSSLGIEDDVDREFRAKADASLAQKIASKPIDEFLETWYRLPMFGQLKHSSAYEEMLNRRLGLDPAQIAKVLEVFGPSTHAYLGDVLESPIPRLYVAGILDKAYAQLAKDVQTKYGVSETYILPDAAHAILIEKPAEVASLLARFLERICD
jgi:2-succinyl-6-hydroxy-2,4-cyclohexadiene-1-carboxylate synthase